MSSKPKLRSFGDRLRQIALFEIGGLLLITPPFAWASGVPIAESIGLLAVLALIASIWNGSYNTCFDWIEGRITGRTADRRHRTRTAGRRAAAVRQGPGAGGGLTRQCPVCGRAARARS